MGSQSLQHLGDSRLRHPEALRDVDLPRLAIMVDEVGDQLDIVLHQFAAPVVAGLAKALDLRVGVDQRDRIFVGIGFLDHSRVQLPFLLILTKSHSLGYWSSPADAILSPM